MDNGKFVQAIQPAAWARQLFPDEFSIQAHLEFTMLMALGILDDRKPPWIDEHPVVRPDGVTWSRYWWPRKVDNPELLPAAKLPPHLLSRILPPGNDTAELGALADALYERVNEYADENQVRSLRQVFDQQMAEALYLQAMQKIRHEGRPADQLVSQVMQINAMNKARYEAMLAKTMPPPRHKPTGYVPSPQQPQHQPQLPTHIVMQPLRPIGHIPHSDWESHNDIMMQPHAPQLPLRPLLRPSGHLPAHRLMPAIGHSH